MQFKEVHKTRFNPCDWRVFVKYKMVISHNLKAISMINILILFKRLSFFFVPDTYVSSRATGLSAFLAEIEAEYMR